ncbi:MAG: GntR family transcriptional regulator [Anaerolineae bacterium]|jgi:DNA-binding GntR family transcriptional regulator
MSDSRAGLTGVQKIQRGPLREQVRKQIKQLILTNRLRPGQPIIIDRLASELGVSHTPVREALAMLEHDGLVMTRPYGTPQVAEITSDDVRDAWEMRLLLEGWAMNKAVVGLSEDDLDKIEESLARARQDAEASVYDTHLASDIAMHDMIMQAADNKLFHRLARLVGDQSIRIRSLVEAIASVEEVLTIVDEHCAILEVLRARDQELAHERLVAHLQAGMERTLVALGRMKENEA